MRLNTNNVIDIFQACLVERHRMHKAVIVDGVYLVYGFDPDKLEQHRQAIEELLRQLPDELQASKRPGGGYTFLNALRDSWGHHWTDLFHHADILMSLGMAIGKVELLTPRITWHMLPGSLPFFRVLA